MGIFDKIKGALGGHKDEVSEGVDKVAEVAKEKAPDQADGAVDAAAEKAKDVIEGQ